MLSAFQQTQKNNLKGIKVNNPRLLIGLVASIACVLIIGAHVHMLLLAKSTQSDCIASADQSPATPLPVLRAARYAC